MNPERILHFWFEDLSDNKTFDMQSWKVRKWFTSNKEFDLKIKEKFENDLLKAEADEYSSWENSAQGLLALIILFDQFSRNIYRGSAKAFAFDSRALNLSRTAILKGFDTSLPMIQRIFVYMPFMHSPDISTQNESVAIFTQLFELAKKQLSPNVKYFEKNLHYAKEHRETIIKYGRFPTRDIALTK